MKREDWGIVPYEIAWKRQEELFNSLVRSKLEKSSYTNHIVFVEHPHVYTIGKSGKESFYVSGIYIASLHLYLGMENLKKLGKDADIVL